MVELGRSAIAEHQVSSELFARALGLFGAELLVNLVALMGQYVGTAMLLTTFDQQLLPGQQPLLP